MKVVKYWNTIKYLKPEQIEYQIINRLKGRKKGKYKNKHPVRSVNLMIESLDLSEKYIKRFEPEKIFENKVCLLNQIVELDYSKEYRTSLLPLYQFNLLYFEYAVAWGASFRKTNDKRYVNKFKECFERYLTEDIPYYSYVCSLQIPNLLMSLELFGKALDDKFVGVIYREIYREYQYIESRLERHLLGNHYFENLKAMVIGAYLFGEDGKCRKYYRLLEKEIHEQILDDGMHFELSPMYHKIILEDLLRLRRLQSIEGVIETTSLEPVIKVMCVAMKTLEDGFGRTPLFNDAGNNVAKPKQDLEVAVEEVCHIKVERKVRLPSAGYYRLQGEDFVVLFDAGKIGPDYMPGHGHCDCLSYELAYKGTPMIVNAGTFQYQGDKRAYYRSTQAHNTLQIEGQEQSEVWGEHRVARRIKNVKCDYRIDEVHAECTTYYGNRLCRELQVGSHKIRVRDHVEAELGSKVMSYIHIAPEFGVNRENSEIVIKEGDCQVAEICLENVRAEILHDGNLSRYAPEFGLELTGTTIVLKWKEDSNHHGYTLKIGDKENG